MSYINAEDVLPKNLIDEIQKYIDGQLMYIPRKNENVLSWGEKNGTKIKLAERNKIRQFKLRLGGVWNSPLIVSLNFFFQFAPLIDSVKNNNQI